MRRYIKIIALTVLCAAPAFAEAPLKNPETPTETPQWAVALKIDAVTKGQCQITNAAGQTFLVQREGTPVGVNLVAGRTDRICYVTDDKGVRCKWGRSEDLLGCVAAVPPSQ